MTKANIASIDRKKVFVVFITKELKIRKSDTTYQWHHFVIGSLCNGFTLPGYDFTFQCL